MTHVEAETALVEVKKKTQVQGYRWTAGCFTGYCDKRVEEGWPWAWATEYVVMLGSSLAQIEEFLSWDRLGRALELEPWVPRYQLLVSCPGPTVTDNEWLLLPSAHLLHDPISSILIGPLCLLPSYPL